MNSKLAYFLCVMLLPALQCHAEATDMSIKPATAATIKMQQKMADSLPKEDGRDERWARQGFIATLDDPAARNDEGRIIHDPSAWDWVDGAAPDTVNPALWRHQKLLRIHGLFKVAEGVWQVRGIDPTNMTLIQGDTGWVVIDPMMNTETARKAMELVNQELSKQPITGIIYTHSHIDHFGGVYGVLGDQKHIPEIIAPEHFLEESGSEWILAGNIMTRRGSFQWGLGLEKTPQGYVGTGLSMQAPEGTIRLIPPSDIVKQTGETRELDGVKFEFQMVPETEAVSEMNVFMPKHRTLLIPEFATCTMHNLQTPRGAKVRDGLQWAAFITETKAMFGDRSDAMINGHCWPRFGNEEIKAFLTLQRDNYKYIHDQTVRMMNLGLTPAEAAETIKPPKSISDEWATHGYYGNYGHNAKGVYQHYIGWWDGIPAHLNVHPQEVQAKRYLEVIGSEKRLINFAKKAMDEGDYRWAAELLNHLVFANPENDKGKALLADCYEQLGYQAESANFRNIYLVAASELRGKQPHASWISSPDLANNMGTSLLLDLIASRLNPVKVDAQTLSLQIHLTDTQEPVLLTLSNSVLVNEVGRQGNNADVNMSATRNQIRQLFLQKTPINQLQKDGFSVSGNEKALKLLVDAIEAPPTNFNVVAP